MSAQLNDLLLALREHQFQIVITYFVLATLSWKHWAKLGAPFVAVAIRTAAALAILALSAYTSTIVLYLLYPNYFDHGQPLLASISWLWMQGHELYPDWTTNDVYGLAYGPVVFLISGVALQLSP